MIYLLKYGSYNRYISLDPFKESFDFAVDNHKVDKDFLELEDKGWYTKVNFKLTTFYRFNNEAFFSHGDLKVKLDEDTQFQLKRYSKYLFLNRLKIYRKEKNLLDITYWPKRNLLKSFDTTFGQEDHDLDLITMVFYVISHDDKMKNFRETGFY